MAEPLPEALGWLDARKRQVVAELATALGAPETVGPNIWGALKDLAKNLDPRVDTQTGDPVQNSRNLMLGFANMLGGIRAGGNPALMMAHGASGLGSQETGLLRELLHPSLAITGHGQLTNPFSSKLLIPREGAFDPAYTASTLFNRDAYVARAKDYPGGLEPSPRERVLTRELSPPTFSEGKTSFPSWSETSTGGGHSLVVNASPAFRSLAEYENSPKGAATLIEPSQKGLPEKYSAALQDEYRAWAERAHPRAFDWLVGLRKAAAVGDRDAMQILAKAQRAPSEYAELKVSGPVPLTGERFAGAILPSYASQWLVDALRGRGITPEKVWGGMTPKETHTLATQLQREAGPVKERPLRVAAGWQAPREFKIEAKPEVPQYLRQAVEKESPAMSSAPDEMPAGIIHDDPSALATANIVWKDKNKTSLGGPWGPEEFKNAEGELFGIDHTGNVGLWDVMNGEYIPYGNIFKKP